MKKKVFSAFLAVIMLMTGVPMQATAQAEHSADTEETDLNFLEAEERADEFADDAMAELAVTANSNSGYCGGEGDGTNLAWDFDLASGVLTITGSGKMADYPTLGPWSSITALNYILAIKEIALPEGLTHIGASAFNGLSNVTKVNIPSSLESIGKNAFNRVRISGTLSLPDTVYSIGSGAFGGCPIEFVSVYRTGRPIAGTGKIGARAFANCSRLQTADLSELSGITAVEKEVFDSCNSLKELILPVNTETLGVAFIRKCASLEEFEIPDKVSFVAYNTFSETSLKTVALGRSFRPTAADEGNVSNNGHHELHMDTLEHISVSAENLYYKEEDGVLFDKEMTTLLLYPPAKTNDTYTVPDGVSVIEYRSSDNIKNLKKVDTNDAVEIRDTFNNCKQLRQVTFGEQTESIAGFSRCSLLESLYIPKDAKEVSGFYQCQSLRELKIDEAVTDLKIYFESSLDLTNPNKIQTIHIPAGVISIDLDGSANLIEYSVDPNNRYYTSVDGVLCSEQYGNMLCSYPAAKGEEVFIVPEWIENMDDLAFRGVKYLKSVVFGENISYFPSSAFSDAESVVNFYFTGEAPYNFPYPDSGLYYGYSPDSVIYYVAGQEGWLDSGDYDEETGTWRGYRLEEWSGDVRELYGSELRILKRTPEKNGYFDEEALIVSMTFNREIESVQTGISFDEDNNTVIHGNFSIVHKVEDLDGEKFEMVYSLSEGDHIETDVSFSKYTVTIDASEVPLIFGETYYVLMDEGVLTFKETDETIGFSGTEWTFTASTAKTGFFRYEANYGVTEYPYTYADSWFLGQSTEYNHDLARMSLRAAIAAYGSGSDSDGSEYIEELMEDELGFYDLDVYYPEPQRNSIGYAIGRKNISAGQSESGAKTLILVAIRGGEYKTEWAGNFVVGTGELSDGIAGDLHEGFSRAAEQVEDGLSSYIRWNRDEGNLEEDCVIWVVGYSRAAATANLLAKRLDDGAIDGVGRNNVFAYCFECPQNSRASDISNEKYDNIINIVNPLDFVTKLAMSDWKYSRYGQTFYIPYEEGVVNYDSLKYKMLQQYISIIQAGTASGDAFAATEQVAGQMRQTEGAMNWIADEFVSPGVYTALYQEALAECIEAFITKDWKPISTTAAAIVVLAKLGLISANAFNLPETPYELVEKLSDLEDDINTAMVLELMLGSGLERGSLKKTPITYAHYPELCMAWLDSLEGETGYASGKYRTVFVNCPVDVSVYDSRNALVGKIVDGEVQKIEGGISVYIDADDQMILSLPVAEEYQINMEATGEGTVTYTVSEQNLETATSERVKSYPLIKVQTGDLLIGSVENLDEVQTAEYMLTLNEAEQNAAADQKGHEVIEYAVTCSVEGDGTVSGAGKALYGEYRKLVAAPVEGAEFIGWFMEDEMISEETEHRFCVTDDCTIVAKFSELPVKYDESTGQLSVRDVAANITVFAAAYSNGQMCYCASGMGDGSNDVVLSIPTSVFSDAVKIFKLDKNLCPQDGVVTIEIG